jgi:hypothetical protein
MDRRLAALADCPPILFLSGSDLVKSAARLGNPSAAKSAGIWERD